MEVIHPLYLKIHTSGEYLVFTPHGKRFRFQFPIAALEKHSVVGNYKGTLVNKYFGSLWDIWWGLISPWLNSFIIYVLSAIYQFSSCLDNYAAWSCYPCNRWKAFACHIWRYIWGIGFTSYRKKLKVLFVWEFNLDLIHIIWFLLFFASLI